MVRMRVGKTVTCDPLVTQRTGHKRFAELKELYKFTLLYLTYRFLRQSCTYVGLGSSFIATQAGPAIVC